MADLSFKQFIEERSKKTKKRTFQFVSEIKVLMLYGEYVAWLADFSKRQKEAPKITASEMLVQLKIINAYHLHLIDKYQKSKSLIKPIEFIPVPEALTPENENNPQFKVPSENALASDIEASVRLRSKRRLNIAAAGVAAIAFLIFLAAYVIPFTVTTPFFVYFNLLLPVMAGSMGLMMAAGHLCDAKHKSPPANQNALFRYANIEKHILPLLIVSTLVSALLLTYAPLTFLAFRVLFNVNLYSAIIAGFMIGPFLGRKLAQYTQVTPQKIAHQLHDSQNEEVIAPLAAPLLEQMRLPDQPRNGLQNAVAATNHCLLSSRLSRKITQTMPTHDEELDISLLNQEVKRQLAMPAR